MAFQSFCGINGGGGKKKKGLILKGLYLPEEAVLWQAGE